MRAIWKTIEFNTNEELTLFVYNCQNTVVSNIPNDTSHSGTFLQVCQKVSNRLLVTKGKPPSSGLIPCKHFLRHLKKIESRVQALQKANATYHDNVVYSFQEDGNREGKFEGTDKNAQYVLHDQCESPHWNASSFDTYLKEDLGDKPKQNQMNQNMDYLLHVNLNAAWKLFNPSTLTFTDSYVLQEEWLKFFKMIMNLHTEEDKHEAAQKAQIVMVRLAATSPEIFGCAFNITSGKLHLVRYAIGWKVANKLLGLKWKWKDHGNLPSVKKRQREGVWFSQTKETAVFRPADSVSTINTASGAFLILSTVTNPYKTTGDKFKVCSRMERPFQTYITFRSFEVLLDHDET